MTEWYAVLMIAGFYVIGVNVIIRLTTNKAEKKQIQGEINLIKSRIKDLKGPGLWSILKSRDKERRKEILASRKANAPLIKEESKKLTKLNNRFMWKFTWKPMLFYLPLVLLLPIRPKLVGVVNQPLIGLFGLLLISIILISYTGKMAGKAPLINHKLQQFIVGFAGVTLLFKSSLSIVWFYLITILMLNIFVKKIMGTD